MRSLKPISHSQKFISDEEREQIKLLKSLISQVQGLANRIEKIPHAENSQSNHLNEKLQFRFKNIEIQIPEISRLNNHEKFDKIQEWLGIACKKIFSVTFNGLLEGQLSLKTYKPYCSEQILFNLIKMIRKNTLTPEDLKFMNDCLKIYLLPYFGLKYPQSQEEEVDQSIARSISQINNLEDLQNDLIFRSQVKFRYNQNANYNSNIMKFINYLITLPNEFLILENGSQSELTFSKHFFNDIEQIFKKVEDRVDMLKMKAFNKKMQNTDYYHQIQQSFEQTEKEKLQYKQKVKSYTTYRIGRKISENVKTFTNKEITSGNLTLTNSAIMRIITKWCEELLRYFDKQYIVNREREFKIRNGLTKFLKNQHLKLLGTIMENQKKNVDEYLKKVLLNNYENQSYFSKIGIDQKMRMYSEQDSVIGNFSAVMSMNNENYSIGYLNALIHGILKGLKHFQEIVKVERFLPNERKYIQKRIHGAIQGELDINELIKQCYDKNVVVEVDYLNDMVPDLITFKIGDILRCKCTSKKNEIVALYRQLQKISYQRPELMKIVRIKNRLDMGTKDVLVNLLYRNTMLIEVQLAIKSDVSKFIEYSSKFAHYIYELERAEFGPISEMCNIWMKSDNKAKFFMQAFMKSNKEQGTINKRKSIKCAHKQGEPIKLSFRCGVCNQYYPKANLIEDPIKCRHCLLSICVYCRLQKMTPQQIFQFIPALETLKYKTVKTELFTRSTSTIPQFGAFLSLKSQEKSIRYFVSYQFDGFICLFEKRNQMSNNRMLSINQLHKIELSEVQRFLRECLIFSSPGIKELAPNISKQQARYYHILPAYLYRCEANQQNSITVVSENIDENFMKNLEAVAEWPDARKINFSNNNFNSLRIFVEDFPNIEAAVLNNNIIYDISLAPEQKNWLKLKYLDLSNNRIQEIPPTFCQLHSLEQLQLSFNQLSVLPQSLKTLYKIKKLYLVNNQITQIPAWLTNFSNMEQLSFADNRINEVPNQIGVLNRLKQLFLNNNQIVTLPDGLCRLINLRSLYIYNNKIINLPGKFEELRSLQRLYANNNQIKDLPNSLKRLSKLKKVFLDFNYLTTISQSLCQLISLQKLLITNNQITHIHHDFGHLLALNQLSLNNNYITKLPESCGILRNLQLLTINHNQLLEIPETLSNLINLRGFECENNQVRSLPKNIGNLQRLTLLNAKKNLIEELPKTFLELHKLQVLNLEENKLQFGPTSFKNMLKMQQLNLSKNLISEIPQDLSQLRELQELLLNQTNVNDLPDLSNACSLRILKISHTKVKFVSQLHNLKILEAKECFLTQLPDSIGKLSNLEIAIVDKNQIKRLPDSICQLKNLKILNLGFNSLEQLPQGIGDLQNLEQLNLVENKIRMIPQSYARLSKLKTILLSVNPLQTIPRGIRNMASIQSIFLQNANIKQLPAEFGQFTYASKIYVNQNQIIQLQPSFYNSPSVQLLCAYQNMLKQINPSIINMKNLKQLQIYLNQITSIPEQLYQLHQLEVLLINNNPIQSLGEKINKLVNLTQLNISETMIRSLPTTFKELVNMKTLQWNQVDIDIENLEVHDFSCMESMIQIQLTGDSLSRYPRSLRSFPNLLFINLTNNQIETIEQGSLPQYLMLLSLKSNRFKSIPSSLSHLQHLQQLNIAANNINSLDPTLFIHPDPSNQCFGNLKLLALDDNQIKEVPQSISNLPSLNKLILTWNSQLKIGETLQNLIDKGIAQLITNPPS